MKAALILLLAASAAHAQVRFQNPGHEVYIEPSAQEQQDYERTHHTPDAQLDQNRLYRESVIRAATEHPVHGTVCVTRVVSGGHSWCTNFVEVQ